MKLLDDTPYHFVGSLKPYDYKHFLEIPLEHFQLVPMENGEDDKKKDDIYAYRTREEALGAERTIVVTYEQLKSFGKTILFTDNHKWSTAQIIRIYRGKARIEDDFKRMKSPIMISLKPVYHWTDQKIRVHAFCCVLALMLLLLLKRKLQRAGIKLSLERMLEELSDVQLSVIKFYDVDKRLCLLNDMNEEQKAIFGVLDLMRYKKLVSTMLH